MRYYLNLNAQPNGEHEIHKENCYFYYMYTKGYNFELLGMFNDELEALTYAKLKYPTFKIDSCAYCCPSTNRG